MKKTFFPIFTLFIFLIILTLFFIASRYRYPGKLTNFSAQELYKAGQQKIKEGNFTEAKKMVEAALDKAPGNVSYLGELAAIKYKMNDYQGALAEYYKILATGRYPGFAFNGIGNIYRDIANQTEDGKQKTENLEKAIEAYQNGIRRDGQYIALYQNYGLMLVSQGKTAEARKILEQGIAKTGSRELEETLKNF